MSKTQFTASEFDTRTTIRSKILNKRKTLSTSFQKEAAQALLLRLKSDPNIKNAKHIALYLATNGELDLQPFIHWCWQHNKYIYLPIIHPFSKGSLLFLRYSDSSTMVANQYNIKEPKLDVRDIKPLQQLDIVLTPLVAFDTTGARIGMGGGYYDRTLANWYKNYDQNKQNSPVVIGVAHDCQQVVKVPDETWDVPLPKIMTPTQTFTC